MVNSGLLFPTMAPAQRYLQATVADDLASKMVFIGGPRQVGKTSLARALLPSPGCELNYDVTRHRHSILKHELPPGDFWFFDEIHKYRPWRNYLKGLFDEHGKQRRILVTGSARLDLYRFGGDSLQGRYFYLRLHPFSLAELGGHADALPALMKLGGFPEPFLSGSERFARRWALSYRERLIREEITSLNSGLRIADWNVQGGSGERIATASGLNEVRYSGENGRAAQDLADAINQSGLPLARKVSIRRANIIGSNDLEVWLSR